MGAAGAGACGGRQEPRAGRAQALRTVEKNGLQATAKKVGLDLAALPFTDARPQRLEWLAAQPGHPPQAKVRSRPWLPSGRWRGALEGLGCCTLKAAFGAQKPRDVAAFAAGRARAAELLLTARVRQCVPRADMFLHTRFESSEAPAPRAQDRVGKSRRMKNPEKLAASTKKPLVARYIIGGRVILTRSPEYVPEYRVET
jgi:hypothetical protein